MHQQARPPKHFPLAMLAKTSLIWVGLPSVIVIAAVLFMSAYHARKSGGQIPGNAAKALDETLAGRRQKDAETLARTRAHPDAARLETELSKLTPEQRKARVNELMDAVAKQAKQR